MTKSPLPLTGDSYILNDTPFRRAGDQARQRALNDAAWGMMVVLPDGQGRDATRLDASWLRDRGWVVALQSPYVDDAWEDRVIEAIRRRGVDDLVLTVVSPGMSQPAAAFSFPPEAVALNKALNATPGLYSAIFPEDRSLLIFVAMDGYIAIAGPPDFVADAVDPAFARSSLDEAIEMSRRSPHGDWLVPELAHYAPFLLDGA